MFKSMRYVLHENFTNVFRIYSISKYELLADMRDSKLGLFWNFANPFIQVLTYWFVFGLVWNKKDAWWNGCLVFYFSMYYKWMQRYFFKSQCHYKNEISC